MRRTLAALIALGAVFSIYLPQRGEDFVYYYCAGRSAAQGRSPYEAAPYQACIAAALGRVNPHDSKAAGSAYPPPAVRLFQAFAALTYPAAYGLWNAALLAASVLLLAGFSARSALGLLLVVWPGFVSSWSHHKLTIPLFLAFLLGIRLVELGRHRLGGALLSVLCLQPQWLAAAGLFLAAQRRGRALAALAAASLLLFLLASPAWLGPWLASAAFHSDNFIAFDNQSLFVSLYKRVGPHFVVDMTWFKAARYGASAGLALLAWRFAARRDSESLALFLGLMVLAQPYSHASDALWAFPLFLAFLARLDRRLRFPAGLLFCAAFLLSGGFAPGRLHRPADRDRLGYLSCLAAAGYGLASFARRRATGR
ncbi:MAG: glycosyltransferase 87 family protein [Elusimicrobiota bacterium]|nr:glycosyltransferase 87 family protein [Elusimicrobiota bacterium]